jgi:hypothetical protein
MKFNLKKFAEKTKDGDLINEVRLQKEHKSAPEEITQKQLEKDRVPEKNVTIEKLLDAKRVSSDFPIIEKQLNDSKSKTMKHRNAEAHKGDINKIEEQRIKNKKQAKKSEPASETNPKKRWWEDVKASNKSRFVTAQYDDYNDDGDSWGRVNKSWYEDGVGSEDDFDIQDMAFEGTGGDPLGNPKVNEINTDTIKGLNIEIYVTPEGMELSEGELQDLAYDKVLNEYDYLRYENNFTPESFELDGDRMVARLVGEGYIDSDGTPDVISENSIFSDIDLDDTDIDGVQLGKVTVNFDQLDLVQDMETDEIIREILEVVNDKYPDLTVEESAIDLKDLNRGVVTFVGQYPIYEDITEASNDFDIIVLADSKKK